MVDAPSIGKKTARRLQDVGVNTVQDLLEADAEIMAAELNTRYITEEVVADWQLQSQLVCQIPNLRGHDAQILVACDRADPDLIAEEDPQVLLAEVEAFLTTPDGKRVLREGTPPDLEEVTHWVEWARQARPLRAA